MKNPSIKDNHSPKSPDFEGLKRDVLDWMEAGLPEVLTYHCVGHTRDVLKAAIRIGEAEGLSDTEMKDLKAAAVLHDSGFVISFKDHEESSCNVAKKWMPKYGYDTDVIERVCEMIRATEIPQKPKSHASEVLCDADLDYLGRDDFWKIANRLYKEFRAMGVIENEEEWNRLQIRFFESHAYFTKTAEKWRDEQKAERLKEIHAALSN